MLSRRLISVSIFSDLIFTFSHQREQDDVSDALDAIAIKIIAGHVIDDVGYQVF
jgi:hypothetical protein